MRTPSRPTPQRRDRTAPAAATRRATPESRIADDMPEVASYLRQAAYSPAAARIALHQRQRALRERHAHLDRSDPRIARALELSAKHHREAMLEPASKR